MLYRPFLYYVIKKKWLKGAGGRGGENTKCDHGLNSPIPRIHTPYTYAVYIRHVQTSIRNFHVYMKLEISS